jgi:transposase-like protein
MAKREGRGELVEVKALLGSDPDYFRTMVQSMVQAALEAEMTDFLGASKYRLRRCLKAPSVPASAGATGADTTSAG